MTVWPDPLGDPALAALLRERIAVLPRVDLGVSVTPLAELRRLGGRLGGPRIHIKRDDLAGGPLGGNKTRMLQWTLARAIEDGADTVVGGSAVQSNYSRQLAAACARAGLDCHLVLRQVRGARDERIEGSLLLDLLYGAHVTFVEDDRARQIASQHALAAELRAAGRTIYLAPTASGADKALHAVAYVDAALELLDQCRATGLVPDLVVVSTLDTTHAGLLLGLRAAGSTIPVLAVSPNERAVFPDRTIEAEVARIVAEAAAILGIEHAITEAGVCTTDAWVGRGYGWPTAEANEAIRLFAATEAVVLDPVYSAKAAAALIGMIRGGELAGATDVVLWHTGGLPALFAYADDLGLETPRPVGVAPGRD